MDDSMVQIQQDLGLEDKPNIRRSSSLPNIMRNDKPPLIQKSRIIAADNISEENKSAQSIKDSESIS
jgi:hypothetical protein